jgi:hypothetical protein
MVVTTPRESFIANMYATWLIHGEGKSLQQKLCESPDVLFNFFLEKQGEFLEKQFDEVDPSKEHMSANYGVSAMARW